MSDLKAEFPDLFFDITTVEKKTPKPEAPSLQQVFLAVLIKSGQNNPGLAASLAQAAEDYAALKGA